jgi:putative ligand-binding protein with streptavidin-like fold
MRPQPRIDLDAAALLTLLMSGSTAESVGPKPARVALSAPVGFWLSEDGSVKLEIKTDGTYDGQVAGRKQRARGTYHIDGGLMTLSDHHSGLHTQVTLYDGELEMAGHRLGPAS